MYQIDEESRDSLLRVTVGGVLSRAELRAIADHAKTLLRRRDPIDLLFLLAPDFADWERGAGLADLALVAAMAGKIRRAAVVGEAKWRDLFESAAPLARSVLRAEARFFESVLLPEAQAWLESA